MIDTHTHLACNLFKHDRDEVIERAYNSGVKGMICVICEYQEIDIYCKIIEKFPFIYGAIGIHPHDAKYFDKNYKMLEEGIKLPRIKALGEIGLDYYYNYSSCEEQKSVFKQQLQFAKSNNLPVIIHSRQAPEDTLQIIKESGYYKGVMHCFSGSKEMMRQCVEIGFYISIAGPVTFPKATNLDTITKLIPKNNLLVETACPYLAPHPKRGKRNEPSFLSYTIEAIANKRNEEFSKISEITEKNACNLFGII